MSLGLALKNLPVVRLLVFKEYLVGDPPLPWDPFMIVNLQRKWNYQMSALTERKVNLPCPQCRKVTNNFMRDNLNKVIDQCDERGDLALLGHGDDIFWGREILSIMITRRTIASVKQHPSLKVLSIIGKKIWELSMSFRKRHPLLNESGRFYLLTYILKNTF
jgi:hypothetical protein